MKKRRPAEGKMAIIEEALAEILKLRKKLNVKPQQL